MTCLICGKAVHDKGGNSFWHPWCANRASADVKLAALRYAVAERQARVVEVEGDAAVAMITRLAKTL